MRNPLQVRPAHGEHQGTLAVNEYKLFVGMIPKSATEADILDEFLVFGKIEEVYILKDRDTHLSKGVFALLGVHFMISRCFVL